MAFDLTQWKQRAAENLRGWKDRLVPLSMNSAYVAVSAGVLWPLVVAARGGDAFAAATALMALVAGLGTNLLANRIQRWTDEANGEADITQQLAEAVQQDAALRAEMDAVLEKLDALALAREALPAPDREWFARTLREELSRLGNLRKYEAVIVGDSNVVVEGERHTVTVLGAEAKLVQPGGTLIEQATFAYSPAVEAAQKTSDARRRYLERLRRACSVLPLAAMGGEEGTEEEVTLDRVYVDLDTTTPVPLTEPEKSERKARPRLALGGETEARPLSAVEAAAQSPRLALLGDPGSGKSTFARRILGWLAAAQLGECDSPPGLSTSLLPILLTLRDLTPRLAPLDLDALPADRQRGALAAAVRDQILDDLARLFEADDFADGLRATLQSGECLLVMDGLDEVPHDLRGQVRQATGAVLTHYGLRRIFVTCRVRSYVGEAIFPNFQAHTLAPFDDDKVRAFATAWYNAQKSLGRFDAEQAERRADDLAEAALGEDLRELSANPMLLTTMAIIHQREIGLPRERVRLYNLAVDVLLRRWQKGKTGALADFLKDDLRVRAVMERLAYESHRAGRGQAADLPRGVVLTLLEAREYLGSPALAAEFLDYVDQRAGLLVGRGGEPGHPAAYSFPHRTFQEYLGGSYMAGQRDAVREYFARAAEGDDWNLAAQLGAEELHYNRRNTNTLLDLAYHLCPSGEPQTEQSERAVLWSAKMAVLAGRETIEHDTGSPDGGRAYLDRLIPRLVGLLSSELTAPERADAGRALGKLGDPRPEVMTLDAMEFCFVPAGLFRMGSDKDHDPEAEDDEQPEHELTLPAYWIARYSVTQVQFRAFVEAGGYRERRYWPEAEKAGRWQEGTVKRAVYDYDFSGGVVKVVEEFACTAYDFGEPYILSNHPVVGVSWYEMLAFTRWLADHWHERKLLPKDWAVRLPSEAEWEKAARGGSKIPMSAMVRASSAGFDLPDVADALQPNPLPARHYPWGDDFDANKANTGPTGVGATSAMGCFAGGASPYGALDMSGNVWEWTRSLWGKDWQKPEFADPYNPAEGREDLNAPENVRRVLRGGAFYNEAGIVRCAVRSGGGPSDGYRFGGYRVVASPFRL